MFCYEPTNTCQVACSSNADCEAAGLGGYVCPSVQEMEAIGLQPLDDGRRFCLNPTCR